MTAVVSHLGAALAFFLGLVRSSDLNVSNVLRSTSSLTTLWHRSLWRLPPSLSSGSPFLCLKTNNTLLWLTGYTVRSPQSVQIRDDHNLYLWVGIKLNSQQSVTDNGGSVHPNDQNQSLGNTITLDQQWDMLLKRLLCWVILSSFGNEQHKIPFTSIFVLRWQQYIYFGSLFCQCGTAK